MGLKEMPWRVCLESINGYEEIRFKEVPPLTIYVPIKEEIRVIIPEQSSKLWAKNPVTIKVKKYVFRKKNIPKKEMLYYFEGIEER